VADFTEIRIYGIFWLFIAFDIFAQWNNSGVFFVTRLKNNATYEVVKDCPQPQHSDVLTDQLIRFIGYQSGLNFP